jgi:TRAP-type C4-dicarboxylate transport system substrate-binding protein
LPKDREEIYDNMKRSRTLRVKDGNSRVKVFNSKYIFSKGGKKMKRNFVVLAMSLLLVIFFAAEKAFTAVEKPIELKFAHFLSPMHHQHLEVFVPFAKEVEERTNGRVKVIIYPAEALSKAKDLYDAAAQGISDISFFIQGYTAGRFPLTSVMELPLGVPSSKIGAQVIWDLYGKYLKSEYQGVNMLSVWTIIPAHIFTTNKPIRTLEDLRGLRIRSAGPQVTETLKELGAAPISLPASDVYDALQRGVVDGITTDFAAMKGFRFAEVAKYCTISNLYVLPMGLAMNQKVWDSLPPDIKNIMEELCGLRFALENAKSFDKNNQVGREYFKEKGGEITELSAEQRKIWGQKFEIIDKKWVANIEAKGLPGKKVFEDASFLVKEYSK